MDPLSQINGPGGAPPVGVVVQAQLAVLQLGAWEGMGVFADGVGRSFIDSLFDPGTGLTYEATQKGGTTEGTVRVLRGTQVLDQHDVPLPNVRSNGLGVVPMHDTSDPASPVGIYLVMTDHGPVPAAAHRLRLADWVGGGSPAPGPGPGPGGDFVTHAELREALAGLAIPTPADFIAAFAAQAGQGGSLLNRVLLNLALAGFFRAADQIRVLTVALFGAGGAYEVWQQLRNTAFDGGREAIYATGLAHRPPGLESAEPAPATAASPWPPMTPAEIAELLEGVPEEWRPGLAATLGTTWQPSGEPTNGAG